MADKYLEFAKKYDNLEEGLIESRDSDLLLQFSPIRRNILSWYAFVPSAAVLEVGCGCGAITELLSERVQTVVALDKNEEYVEVNRYLHGSRDNVSIRQGGLEQLGDGEVFDYILLLGTLSDVEEPASYLAELKRYLAPDGTLIIAMENKYGLKYFAGANEEYSGTAFAGIEGYSKDAGKRLYAKAEIERALDVSGFSKREVYYPIPDFRLPLEIYSEDNPPKSGALREPAPDYAKARIVTFDEVLAFSNICKDGLFDTFADAYLMFCRQ